MLLSLILKGEGMMLEDAVVDFLFSIIMMNLRYFSNLLIVSIHCLIVVLQ
jgi:hypothetical protein